MRFSGKDYSTTMVDAPFFIIVAPIMMLGVRRGEAVAQPELVGKLDHD